MFQSPQLRSWDKPPRAQQQVRDDGEDETREEERQHECPLAPESESEEESGRAKVAGPGFEAGDENDEGIAANVTSFALEDAGERVEDKEGKERDGCAEERGQTDNAEGLQ